MRTIERISMKKNVIRFCSFLLIAGGIFLLFNKPLRNYFVKRTGEQYKISQLDKAALKKNNESPALFDFDQVQPLNSAAIFKSQLSGNKNNLPVIASIAIPSVTIHLPIFKGLSNEALFYGAGTLSPDQKMGEGNYGLASHLSDQPNLLFTPLQDICIGDFIYLTDLTNVYTYVAISKEIVSPNDVEVLEDIPEKKLVTLVTCGDLYAKTRLVVQGELENVVPMNEIPRIVSEAFELPIQSY